jgi:hypothetical protein
MQLTLEVELQEQEGASMSTMELRARGRTAIRRTLSTRAGEGCDAPTMAEITVNVCRDVAARLVVVLGQRGVDVLFRRSIHLSSAQFSWLAMREENGADDVVLVRLGEVLARQEVTVAAEASYTLLVTFTELLATLIGESLTETLLSSVWVPASPSTDQENVP